MYSSHWTGLRLAARDVAGITTTLSSCNYIYFSCFLTAIFALPLVPLPWLGGPLERPTFPAVSPLSPSEPLFYLKHIPALRPLLIQLYFRATDSRATPYLCLRLHCILL